MEKATPIDDLARAVAEYQRAQVRHWESIESLSVAKRAASKATEDEAHAAETVETLKARMQKLINAAANV